MKFKVEQIAITPANTPEAMKLLEAMGAKEWTEDIVHGTGTVNGIPADNKAHLRFNYEIAPCEFEVLNYKEGNNWLAHRPHPEESAVSHLSMHCTAEEAEQWKMFFVQHNIPLVQELATQSHSNEAVGERRWNYYIFGTRPLLGLDIKIIVRR